jgi:hypothetical protein
MRGTIVNRTEVAVSQHAGVSHEPALRAVFNRWVGVVHDNRAHSGGHAGGEGGGKEEMGTCKMQYTAGLESPGMITGSCALHFFFFTLWTADSGISYNCARESLVHLIRSLCDDCCLLDKQSLRPGTIPGMPRRQYRWNGAQDCVRNGEVFPMRCGYNLC